jgi:excisionase family DNA binding protein
MSTLARQALSVPEAAEVLGISTRAAWHYAKTGQLPTVRLGGRVLVPVRLLDELLNGATSPEMREPGLSRTQGSRDDNDDGHGTSAAG